MHDKDDDFSSSGNGGFFDERSLWKMTLIQIWALVQLGDVYAPEETDRIWMIAQRKADGGTRIDACMLDEIRGKLKIPLENQQLEGQDESKTDGVLKIQQARDSQSSDIPAIGL